LETVSSSFALTDIGQARGQNEDEARAVALPDGAELIAVADGVGGAPGGEVASREALETLVRELSERGSGALEQAIAAANERIFALQTTRPEWKIMATTLVAAVIEGGRARVANLGDSRAYCYVGGELRQVSRDDSWVAEAVATGEIRPEQAARHPWRNVVTKGIGIKDGHEPSYYDVSLAPGDALLLCTDGLFRMLSDDDIARIIRGAGDAESAAAALVDAANAAGGMDNIGVAIVFA